MGRTLRALNLAAVAVAGLTLVAASTPGWWLGPVAPCAVGALLILGFWMSSATAVAVDPRSSGNAKAFVPLLAVPALGVLVATALALRAPLIARVWCSESALRRAVVELCETPAVFDWGGPREGLRERIGLFHASRSNRGDGVVVPWGECVAFSTLPTGFIDAGGIVFSPGRRPTWENPLEGVTMTHLYGDWYAWEERW